MTALDTNDWTGIDIVDTHTHAIASDTQRYPLDPIDGKPDGWVLSRPLEVGALVDSQIDCQISHAVLVQAATAYGYDNSYVVDAVGAHSNRLVGVGCLDPFNTDALEQLRYWVEERFLAGARIFISGATTSGRPRKLDDVVSFPFWERVTELGIPITIQMQPDSFPALQRMLERFPTTRVVLEHLGKVSLNDGPPFEALDQLLALASHTNLFLKLTHRSLDGLAAHAGWSSVFFERLVMHFGSDRVAWGSNFPSSDQRLADLVALALRSLEEVRVADRNWIMSGTARRLYPRLHS